jgi:hypothetical protein
MLRMPADQHLILFVQPKFGAFVLSVQECHRPLDCKRRVGDLCGRVCQSGGPPGESRDARQRYAVSEFCTKKSWRNYDAEWLFRQRPNSNAVSDCSNSELSLTVNG